MAQAVARLEAVAGQVNSQMRYALERLLKSEGEHLTPDDIEDAVKRVSRVAVTTTTEAKGIAIATAQRVNQFNRRDVRRTIGIDVPEYSAPLGERWRREHIALIQSIPEDAKARFTGLLRDASSKQTRVETITKALREQEGITHRRARLIARDQVLTLNAKLNADRHKRAGIEEYEWLSLRDGSVRGNHAHLHGKRFRYDDPPMGGGTTEDEAGNPGDGIGCRCQAVPVIPEFEKAAPKPKAEEKPKSTPPKGKPLAPAPIAPQPPSGQQRALFWKQRAEKQAGGPLPPAKPHPKGSVLSNFAPRPQVAPLPKKVDGLTALATEAITEYESSHDALRDLAGAKANDKRRVVRNLLRHHLPVTSRDLARDLPGAHKFAVDPKVGEWKANAVHDWDGGVMLSPETGGRLDALQDLILNGKAHQASENHWDALRTVVHEELHGASNLTPDVYRSSVGRNTEEAFTEILARRVVRQVREDVTGYPQLVHAAVGTRNATVGILPRGRNFSSQQRGGSYSNIIGDLVDAFGGDTEQLERGILHARRARSDVTTVANEYTQLREALSVLEPKQAAAAFDKLTAAWKDP